MGNKQSTIIESINKEQIFRTHHIELTDQEIIELNSHGYKQQDLTYPEISYYSNVGYNMFDKIKNAVHHKFPNFEIDHYDHQIIKYDMVGGSISVSPHIDDNTPYSNNHNVKNTNRLLTAILYYDISDTIIDGCVQFYDDDSNIIAEHSPKVGDILIFAGNVMHGVRSLSGWGKRYLYAIYFDILSH
jgi:hypothetical protein